MNDQSSSDELFYLQDKRSLVGNSMLWWAKDGAGYICDIRKAHVFTKDEAYRQHDRRPTDIPWPKVYIDKRISHHVDFQNCKRAVAMSEAAASPKTETLPRCTCGMYPFVTPLNDSVHIEDLEGIHYWNQPCQKGHAQLPSLKANEEPQPQIPTAACVWRNGCRNLEQCIVIGYCQEIADVNQ